MTLDNHHPVDRLAMVRERIKELQEIEAAAKAEVSAMMGAADALGGDAYIARQSISERKGGIDEKAMRAAGIDPDSFRKPASVVVTIRTEARVMEVA